MAHDKATIGPPTPLRRPLPSLLLLAGPTAVGKSEIALQLAGQLGGEIVSVDSMQVYRGLDIGTAKPSAQERQRVPHHLLDVVDIGEPFDAAQFAQLATLAVGQIQARGRLPILCGGTGLYFKAFLAGLGAAPPANPRLRAELEATPLADLLRELEQRDPVTYIKIDRHNPRRIIRAVEVVRLTGKSFAEQRADWHQTSRFTQAPAGCYGLARSPADLRARIEVRVDSMFRCGLVAETAQLLQRGLAKCKTAAQAIGYRQVVEHLHGERSLEETIALIKTRTWQFARRQMTWFRRQTALEWMVLEPKETASATAARIVAVLNG